MIRASALFGVTAKASDQAHILITKRTGGAMGLLVDRADDVLIVSPDQLRGIRENYAINDCAEAQFTHGEQQFTLIDAGKLVLREEEQRLAELTSRIQHRLDAVQDPRL